MFTAVKLKRKNRRLEAESLKSSAPKQFSSYGGNSAPQKPLGIAGAQAAFLSNSASSMQFFLLNFHSVKIDAALKTLLASKRRVRFTVQGLGFPTKF